MTPEKLLLGCVFIDNACLDRAIESGINTKHFGDARTGEIWDVMVRLRTAGTEISTATVALGWKGADYALVGACEGGGTTASLLPAIEALLWSRRSNELKSAATDLSVAIMGGGDKEDVLSKATAVAALAQESEVKKHRPLKQVADEAIADAETVISGVKDNRPIVRLGLADFDRKSTGIAPHEYCLLGARTSHGKSSFLLQLAANNLAAGLKVAIFTLETSDKSVLAQIAAQRAKVNLRNLARELPERQQEYLAQLRGARESANLMIFDRDMTLRSIESRCRLLATSFQPNLVILDYIGLVGIEGTSAYERMSMASKSMIPLRKQLGCAMIVGAQLNRGNEKEDRRPGRTDFRDAGGLEEDAHRIIALHRPMRDFNGNMQDLDQDTFDYELLQLKLRDGPITGAKCKFHAPTTRFYEEGAS